MKNKKNTDNRIFAKITGYALLLMAVIGGFAFGHAFPTLFNPNQLDVVQSNLAINLQLYKLMLLAILIVLLLDILVSWSLYKYFKEYNQKITILAGAMRMAYTVLLGIALFFLAKNACQPLASNAIIIQNFQAFQTIWSAGLILFGIHLLLIGYLMKLHSRIPKILWYLALIAGVSYVVVHFLKLTLTQSAWVGDLEMILALPMAVGELGLAIWLIVKGGKRLNS
tara:strand:+ start:2307 stop:2981 length:675 start_codon:yes stop_codon:yes gene_type:complete